MRYAPQLGDYSEKIRELARRAGGRGAAVGMRRATRLVRVLVLALSRGRLGARRPPDRGRRALPQANELARAGDYPKAIAVYARAGGGGRRERVALLELGAGGGGPRRRSARRSGRSSGRASSSRATAPSPARSSGCVRRANLDPAEIAPEPLAGLRRAWPAASVSTSSPSRSSALSLVAARASPAPARPAGRRRSPAGRRSPSASSCAAVAGCSWLVPRRWSCAAGRRCSTRPRRRPRPSAPCAKARSCRSSKASGGYLRVEDFSGARGWALAEDVRRLDRAPRAATDCPRGLSPPEAPHPMLRRPASVATT